jgi:hypothetical protein
VRVACSDIQHSEDSGISRALNDFVPVVVELLAVDMAMRIDKDHFNRAPTFTSSRNVAIAGESSSTSDAAQIIPCDSRPRIFRGYRFATTTTLRPMSFSGS